MTPTQTLLEHFLAQHIGEPQSEERVRHAIGQIESGLSDLHRLGHVLHLAPGPELEGEPLWDWPKLFFPSDGREPRLCWSSGQVEELGPGYWPSRDEAERQRGLDIQFAGRGGVQRGQALVVMPGTRAPD